MIEVDTGLLHADQDAIEHLKALNGGLDEPHLTTPITERIHGSLSAAKSMSVSLDFLVLEVGHVRIVNVAAKLSEELSNFLLVGVILSLFQVPLQGVEVVVRARTVCVSPGTSVAAGQVDAVFFVWVVVSGAPKRESNVTQVVDVVRADESEPFAGLAIEVKHGRSCIWLRLQLQDEAGLAVEDRGGFLPDVRGNGEESRERALGQLPVEGVAVDH